MRQISLIVIMVIFAGCGPSHEEIDNVATVTCNILGASRGMDGAMRIREINNAREKIGAEPYLGGDDLIRQSLEYGLCESMVKEGGSYFLPLADHIEEAKVHMLARQATELKEAERIRAIELEFHAIRAEERQAAKQTIQRLKQQSRQSQLQKRTQEQTISEKRFSPANASDQSVKFSTHLDQTSLYVQAELIMTITLQQAVNLDGGEISDFDLPNATTESLERRVFQRRAGNRTWLVTELRYAVYPQRSGTLNIPAITFTAREVQPGRSLLGDRLGRKIALTTDPIEMTVKPIPPAFPDGYAWIPARVMYVDEEWSFSGPRAFFKNREATRKVTATAEGFDVSQLPALYTPHISPDRLLTTPSSTMFSSETEELESGISSYQTASATLKPLYAGGLSFPELKIPWWNTIADQLEWATIPQRKYPVYD